MPVPPHIAIEARRCLARFRLPPGFQSHFPPRPEPQPDAPSREPSAAPDAAPSTARPDFAAVAAALKLSGDASANGGQQRQIQLAGFGASPNHSIRFHAKEREEEEDADDDGGGGGEGGDLFSPHERAAYQEYLRCIVRECMGRECGEGEEEDVPDDAMTVSLLKHQRKGLSWMRFREKSPHCAGGILADEQGLGKTITTIALILKEMPQQSKFKSSSALRSSGMPAGGTLVVCSKSTLLQWEDEFARRVTKGAKLSVVVHHGASRTVDPEELAKADIVLTTYGVVRQDHSIDEVEWFRIVLDEAHTIRNPSSEIAEACWGLEAERRWCLSGTPMEGKMEHLYSYLHFLKFEPYSDDIRFSSLLETETDANASLVREKRDIVLKMILLRHMKETLIDEEPITKIPPKIIHMREIYFTPEELDLYWYIIRRRRQKIKYQFLENKRRSNWIKDTPETAPKLLAKLQKACNHPSLVYMCIGKKDLKKLCSKLFENSYVSSKIKAIMDILNTIINRQAVIESDNNAMESGSSETAPEKALIFSRFTKVLDLLELQLIGQHIQFRRLDGRMEIKPRKKAVRDFDTNPEVRVLLLSLEAAGLGLNLNAASHVIIVHPSWNPFVEKQAMDRAHRIGQSHPVNVYRLFTKCTVEERILNLQKRKEDRVNRAFGKGIFGDDADNNKKPSKEDLKYLLHEGEEQEGDEATDPFASLITKSYATLNCQRFLWLIHRDQLPTRDFLFRRNTVGSSKKRRNIVQSPGCEACGSVENIPHLFLQCRQAMPVWSMLGVPEVHDLQDVRLLWDSTLVSSLEPRVRTTILTVILWNIWKARNAMVFDHDEVPTLLLFQRMASDLEFLQPQASSSDDQIILRSWQDRFMSIAMQ